MPQGSKDALLQEHEELVQLFIHEDVMAWQLNITFLGTNGAVLAACYALDAFDRGKSIASFPVIALLCVAVLINLASFFVSQRSKIHRMSRLFRAYRVEDDLKKLGITIETFTSGERAIAEQKVLDARGFRRLRWHERMEALDFRAVYWILAIAIFMILIWVIQGRPQL